VKHWRHAALEDRKLEREVTILEQPPAIRAPRGFGLGWLVRLSGRGRRLTIASSRARYNKHQKKPKIPSVHV
jgi:hypothetical protein